MSVYLTDFSCYVCTGILLVALSIIIMYYNIGLPNSLRGFLFYSQVSNCIETLHFYCLYVHTSVASYVAILHNLLRTIINATVISKFLCLLHFRIKFHGYPVS